MKYAFFLVIVLCFSACQNSLPTKSYQRSEHSKIAEKITATTAQKIESETGLHLIGIGGGMMNQVQMMALSFDYYGEITVEQGRELVIYCVKEYLAEINANEEIRSHLICYPFTSKQIEISIFIRKSNGGEVRVGDIAVVASTDGIVKYYVKQPGLPSIRQDYKETYEEAVTILETEGVINKIRKNTFHM